MQTILITNALLVNEGSRSPSDVFIKGGRIEKIAPALANQPADTVIDAKGKALLPGMIDCHVHCRDPGLEQKADLHSETRAAVAGGITSIMEMLNTQPAAVTNEILEQKFAIGARKCVTNYSFHLGASNTNLDELLAMDPKTVCGVKLFMGASTGGLLVDRFQTLENIQLENTYTGKTAAALLHDLRSGKLDGQTVLYWNTLNSRDFSEEIANIDFHALPPAFHPYFQP